MPSLWVSHEFNLYRNAPVIWKSAKQPRTTMATSAKQQDKKRTWISEIRLTFVPSCSRVRRQLLHFHVVCKTLSIFQELTSIFSFRKTRWRQNHSENRNKRCNQSKYMLRKTQGLCVIFIHSYRVNYNMQHVFWQDIHFISIFNSLSDKNTLHLRTSCFSAAMATEIVWMHVNSTEN